VERFNNVPFCTSRELRRYRQFYLTYPRIRESLSPELGRTLLPQTDAGNNRESLSPELGVAAFSHENVGQMNIYQEGA